uniref:Glia maturation factor gamma n=1 Tax=Varanus komodoensis TaxID=61221 RepID=A0A8D2JAM6_VARKO
MFTCSKCCSFSIYHSPHFLLDDLCMCMRGGTNLVSFFPLFLDISPEELKSELPERQPRYPTYSYKYVHADGRISYPLCFIFCSPLGCKPEQQMMYAGSKNRLVQAAEFTKVLQLQSSP